MTFAGLLRLAAFLLLVFSSDAVALCGDSYPQRACTPYWTSDMVFVAEAVRVAEIRAQDPDSLSPEPGFILAMREVRLRVVEAFRGVNAEAVVLRERVLSTTVAWKEGELYFVYASWDAVTGQLATSSCVTRTLADARRDIEYARWVRSERSKVLITGTVGYDAWDELWGTSEKAVYPTGGSVTLTGAAGSWTSAIDAADAYPRFRFEVPPGTYELRVNPPELFTASEPEHIELLEAGRCLDVSTELRPQAAVSGRVLDVRGRPVPNCTVVFVRHQSLDRADFRHEERVMTGADGEFTHAAVPPGEYALGVHIDGESRQSGYPAYYFPGVEDPRLAQTIEARLGSHTDVGNFTLPVAVDKVTIAVRVLMPDGAPAAGARVLIESESRSFDVGVLLSLADANGLLEIPVLRGRRYRLTASGRTGDSGENASHAATEVTARSGAAVTLRLRSD